MSIIPYLKNKDDLYYESYKTGINKDNIKHQKILNEFDVLREDYLNLVFTKLNNGKTLKEIEEFIDNSPVKNIKWWFMKKIKEKDSKIES